MTSSNTYGWKQGPLPRRGFRVSPRIGGWAPDLDIDLRPLCPAVWNQNPIGSCTGCSMAAAIEFAALRATRDALWPEPLPLRPSPLWIYYKTRALWGMAQQDVGASLFDTLKVVKETGIGAVQDWPYLSARWNEPPSVAADTQAVHYRVVNSDILAHDADTVLATLQAGFPIVFGSTIYGSFETDSAMATGRIPMPGDAEDPVGGHAMMAVGVYHDGSQRRVRIQNSWGASWGDHGFGSMPLDYLLNPGLTGELLVVRVVQAA